MLLKRKKGQHLTQIDQMCIVQMMKKHSNDHSMLLRLFRLSKSTIRRLNKEYEKNHQKNESRLLERKNNYELSLEAKDLVEKFIKPPTAPVTISKIQNLIHNELGEVYSIYIIRKYIRDTLKYRFKKGSSRPPKYISKAHST